MKIKRITLYNIGPYVNVNTFDFSICKDKNIVLIGGKNGSGKTTFFKAIKTCLYGCRVWGFDAAGKEYYSIINSLVNFKTQYDNTTKAYIEIELLFDDGKQKNTYVLHREWMKIKTSTSEFFNVKKNGDLIIGNEEDDFINYLLSIIPPDMFNFYFFDGESIAEFFLGADGNKNFRNAFLKLYGLDTLSIMIENFNRSIKKNASEKSHYEIFARAKINAEKEKDKLNSLTEEIKDIENKIDLFHIKLKSMQVDYAKEGGIGLSDWKELNTALLKEENIRENLNKWMKEIANHYLPFIILEKQLDKLLSDITLAQEHQKAELLFDTLSSEQTCSSIDRLLLEKKITGINALDIASILRQHLKVGEKANLFDFSANQISRIVSQIYEKIEFDKTQVKKTLSQLNMSIKKSKKLRDQMVSSSIDGFEAFIGEKEKIEESISTLSILLEKKRQEMDVQKTVCDNTTNVLIKVKENYEFILRNKSISNLSEKATAAYSLLEEKLVRNQAKLLQEEFMRCFSSIINKDNFIDGIVVDNNINIVPYKYIKVTKSQFENYYTANKGFLEHFNKAQIAVDINKLEFDSVKYIILPSPINVPFSQGERQVYIMSIYLALLKTSHKDIPFFVDTPFARIDSGHRANIIMEFFNKTQNQLFVLSTDEEIVGEYKKMMESRLSDIYTLQINDYGTTRIIPNEYFGDK